MLAEVSRNFALGTPVTGRHFVDRRGLMQDAEGFLRAASGNLLITGERRAGKTSLCLELLTRASTQPGTLPVYMSMEVDYGSSPSRFSQAVLLHVIRIAGKVLYRKTYSDLLHDLAKPARVDDARYSSLLRVFSLARSTSSTMTRANEKSVGATLVASAGLAESQKEEITVTALNTFEYLALLDEVVDLLSSTDIGKVIIVVDEANKLALQLNEQVIRDNLTLFTSRGLQFCFVTTGQVIAAVPEIAQLFQHRVDVAEFESEDALVELVEACCSRNGASVAARDIFSEAAMNAIWKISGGLPHRIQALCKLGIERAISSGDAQVGLDHLLDLVEIRRG